MSNLDHIRSYYEALNTGDVALIASHFTDDAVHYYTRLGPHRGRQIAENAKWGIDNLEGRVPLARTRPSPRSRSEVSFTSQDSIASPMSLSHSRTRRPRAGCALRLPRS
jgi:hypothetical protein